MVRGDLQKTMKLQISGLGVAFKLPIHCTGSYDVLVFGHAPSEPPLREAVLLFLRSTLVRGPASRP